MIERFDPRRHLAWGAGKRSAVPSNGAAGHPFLQLIRSLDRVRSRHTAIFGDIGTGKTTLIQILLLIDISRRLKGESPAGFAVVDVVGDLTRDMLARIGIIRSGLDPEKRRLLDRLIYVVDPKMEGRTPAYDLFDLMPGETPEKRADDIALTIQVVEQDDPRITVRVKATLKHGCLALIVTGRQFRDLPRLLREAEFRDRVVEESRHPKLQAFFRFQFPTNEQKVRERVESSLNRLGLLFDNDVEDFLTGPSTFNLAKAMDDGAFIFFYFPSYKLGEEASYLLAALMMAEMHRMARQRLEMPESERKPFSIIADEFQLFASESILRMLEQDRKAKIQLVTGTQLVKGRPQEQHIRDAARSIANTIISFRQPSESAVVLQPDLLSPKLRQIKHTTIRYQKVPGFFGEYTQLIEDPVFMGQDEIRNREIRKITHLPDRHFWLRVRGEPYSLLVQSPNLKSIEELAEPNTTKALVAELIGVSDRRIGRPKYKAPPSIDPNAEYMFPAEHDQYGW
ncbi:MAG: type IV secretory system conjugative DNA transfer family protein [Anaerolineales bacterium]